MNFDFPFGRLFGNFVITLILYCKNTDNVPIHVCAIILLV